MTNLSPNETTPQVQPLIRSSQSPQKQIQLLTNGRRISLGLVIFGGVLLIGFKTFMPADPSIDRVKYFWQALLKAGIVTATFLSIDATIKRTQIASENSRVSLAKELESQLKELNKKIGEIPSKEDFNTRISSLNDTNSPLKRDIEAIGIGQKSLLASIEPIQSEIKKLDIELKDLKSQIGNEPLDSNRRIGIQRFEVELSQLKQAVEQASNPALQNMLQRIETEFSNLKQEIGPVLSNQNLQGAIQALQAEFRTLVQDQQRLFQVIQELKAEFDSDREAREAELQKQSEADAELRKELMEGKEKGTLSWRDLSGARLAKIDLDSADLRNCNLYEADLSEATLSNTVLREANLRKANLHHAKLSKSDLSHANLSEANLSGRETDLRDAKLVRAWLNEAFLSRTNLAGANLKGASLIKAYLLNAKLTEANLSEAKLNHAILTDADLIDAVLHGTDLSSSDLGKAKLNGADLSDAVLNGADLTGAELTNVIFTPKTEFVGVTLTNATLDEKLRKHIEDQQRKK